MYRLYRALRVYSLGFHEVVYELCDPVHHRDALLHDVWQFFVSLWDGALRVGPPPPFPTPLAFRFRCLQERRLCLRLAPTSSRLAARAM